MCGVVAAAARAANIVPVLLEGLRKFEYRGYDSVGIAGLNSAGVQRVRTAGCLAELAVASEGVAAHTGISRTRWATHGASSERNAHLNVSGGIAVVHNVIIVNYEALRSTLSAQGYVFISDADTETIAHLIEAELCARPDLLDAVLAATRQLVGADAIALINELAITSSKMSIDPETVLQAAGSKWNFLPCPGLVGSHFIGVAPHYLAHKAQSIGYHPEIVLAGRRLNNGMGAYVVSQLVKAMLKCSITVEGASVLVVGLTFKENCSDLRNTRIFDIVKELGDYNIQADVYDPWVGVADAELGYPPTLIDAPQPSAYDAIIVDVVHHQFKDMGAEAIREMGKPKHVVYGLKYVMPRSTAQLRVTPH